ncbi:MAG: hypothetical protein F4047_10385 [Caldilineaceae bacterium SB0670_bin_27]|uniref:DUF4332 domain-containing protein n=1 Tax=Caldilineaceae bacterium SB0664_bin_27 TaxID=2605260 RepID=A0A6B0YPJ7_9CHLR|nr:hypothetical protein [Caldilineaceae bacterium SB0664_bin_27]MYJ78534.1 hypothetical protein [Caldilineaceae bacterium SB0670_bin_27]
MDLTSLLGYILVGLLFGWVSSTLVEWVWYRGRRRRLDLSAVSPAARGTQPLPAGTPAQTYGAPPGPAASANAQEDRRRARKNARPEPLPAQDLSNRPDNLTAVYGIGDLYERRLYQVGIFTWDQLSRADAESLQQITRALPGSDTRAWTDQARELAQANNRIGAIYDGPLPEDLTRIAGVDQVFEDALYAAGIFTYRQLAERTPDELARIIPAHLAGEELDFVSWVVQADSLRDEYYTDEPPIL